MLKSMNYNESEIYMISLHRKEVYNLSKEKENKPGDNAILATDYFDAMRYKRIDIADLHNSFIEGEMDHESSSIDISMQCFPLICPGNCIKRHEKETNYGNPFDDFQNHASYINVINVYFAAEIFTTLKSHERSLLEIYEDDLHTVLNNCAEKYRDQFKYRIYRSISSGDLAVIVSCNDAEMPFYISNAIRARYSYSGLLPLVLYKTYTILCIKDVSPKTMRGKFILRFRYSNLYWSQKGDDKNILKLEKSIFTESMKLNGRYDFYFEFSAGEFRKIFPYIMKSKLGTQIDETGQSFDEPRLEYIRILIEQNYLSFINERYVFDVESYQYQKSDQSKIIDLSANKKLVYIEETIENKLDLMRKKGNKQYRRIQRIWDYRKDLAYNMRLFQRLIKLCSSINGLSETRINGCILLNRLQAVMEGIDYYLYLWEKGYKEVLPYLDKSLRESITALNCYADYIISNNLQSLQVPNYNLESSISVEKYIIAYTGLLDTIIEKYLNSETMTKTKANEGLPRLIPILVPKEGNESLSITVQFRAINNWELDKTGKQLLIVKCPTFRYMTSVPELMASIFHELAHQFRYEDRRKRNKVLIRYMIQLYLEQTVIQMFSGNPDIRIDDLSNLKARLELEDKMTNAFITCFYPQANEAYNLSLPLLYERVRTDVKNFVDGGILIEQYRYALHELITVLPVSDLREQEVEIILILISELNKYPRWSPSESIKFLQNIYKIIKKRKKNIKKWLNYTISILHCAEKLPADVFLMREEFFHRCAVGLYGAAKSKNISIHSIRHYLGFDHPTEENRKFFRMKFDKSLAEMYHASKDVVNERIIEYREQTSDMFMVSLMNMNAFGYLYMMARNIQFDERQIGIKVRRIAIVMFICFCDGKKRAFNNTLAEIYQDANCVLSKIVREYCKCINMKPPYINKLLHKMGNEAEPKNIVNHLEALIQEIDMDDQSFIEHMRTFRNLFRFLLELNINGEKYISEIDYYGYVKKDLTKGYTIINNFRDEFMADEEHKVYYQAASELLSHKHINESERFTHNSELMIEFIMKMYYETKENYGRLVASSAEQMVSP